MLEVVRCAAYHLPGKTKKRYILKTNMYTTVWLVAVMPAGSALADVVLIYIRPF